MKRLKSLLVPVDLPARPGTAMLLLRLVAGAAFVMHGMNKIRNPFGWMGADSSMPGFTGSTASKQFDGTGVQRTLC